MEFKLLKGCLGALVSQTTKKGNRIKTVKARQWGGAFLRNSVISGLPLFFSPAVHKCTFIHTHICMVRNVVSALQRQIDKVNLSLVKDLGTQERQRVLLSPSFLLISSKDKSAHSSTYSMELKTWREKWPPFDLRFLLFANHQYCVFAPNNTSNTPIWVAFLISSYPCYTFEYESKLKVIKVKEFTDIQKCTGFQFLP